MDLNFKNISWVGKNISQKFETMCQEVDNIVCQDTVKYVESRVQAVGESVKKLYSDVVQDFVPPLVDPGKNEVQEVVLKGNASISTYIKSMIGLEGNSVDTVNKQLHEELIAGDPLMNQVVHLEGNSADTVNHQLHEELGAVDPMKNQLVHLEGNSVDTVHKQLHEELGAVDPIKNQVVHLEGNSVDAVNKQLHEELGAVDPKKNQVVHLEGNSVDTGNKQLHEELGAVDPIKNQLVRLEGISVDTVNKQVHEELGAVDPIKDQVVHAFSGLDLVNEHTAPIFVDSDERAESDLHSGQVDDVLMYKILDVGVEENAIKEKSRTSETSKLLSLGEKDFIEASSFSEFGDYNQHACGVVAEVSPATSVHVVDCQSTQKLDTVCDNFADVSVSDASNTLAASEMDSSVVSNSLCENSPENFPTEIVFNNDPVDEAECVSDNSDALTSSKLSLITSQKDKAAELVLINSSSVMSLESLGEDEYESTTKFTGSQTKISPSCNAGFCGAAQLDSPTMTSSDIGFSHDPHDDNDYSGMETIELVNEVKPDDSCLLVDNSALYAVPCRTQKPRSFKKRIQDAFTSRKRLTKEYEQLGIWFGDVYMGSNHDTLQSHVSPTTSSTSDANNLISDQACDSEWELL